MFVGSSFRAAFPEPKDVGTFEKVLVESVMPMFLRSPMRMAVLLPNVIGALTKDILQALHCALQDVAIIPVRSQRPTPSNLHLSREGGFHIDIGKERRVDGQLQCFCWLIFIRNSIRCFDHDGKGVENIASAVQHVNQTLSHCRILPAISSKP